MRPVYLHGRSLISALGANLPQALATLAAGGTVPQRVLLPGGTDWPCYTIEHHEPDWRKRARQLICAAAEEAGLVGAGLAEICSAPLFIASSSLDIGAIEIESGNVGEGYDFAEQIAAWLNWIGPVYLVSSA